MKKIILLISFCCFGLILQAQEFWILNIGYMGHGGIDKELYNTNIWEKRLMGNPLLLRIGRFDDTKKLPQFAELREKWLKKIKNKVLSKELKHCLNDTSTLGDKQFGIDVYFEKDGTVSTITFEIEHRLYEILPEKWVKETFNTLMKEQINATKFWDFTSSKQTDPLGVIRISVKDLIIGKIRNQEELTEKPTTPQRMFPPCGTSTNKKMLGN